MSETTDAADRIKNWLITNCVLSAGQFNPGLDSERIKEVEYRLGWELPDEVRDLYQWHDGTAVPEGALLSQYKFVPQYYFISLQQALDAKRSNEQMNEEMPEELHGVPGVLWQPKWLPVFDSGNNEYLALDCSQATVREAPVISTNPQDGVFVYYKSLTSMLLTIARCCEGGAIFLKDSVLRTDHGKKRLIAQDLNPGVDVWWQ